MMGIQYHHFYISNNILKMETSKNNRFLYIIKYSGIQLSYKRNTIHIYHFKKFQR